MKTEVSSAHDSLKLRDSADTQTCRTGALGLTTNVAGGGLLEDDLEDAVLQVDFEAFLIGEREQRTLCLLERAIGLEAEVLLGERGHQSVDCRRSGEAM